MHIDAHFTVADVADRLSLHRNTVMKLIASGAFGGAFQIGRNWRIPVAGVTAYIARRTKAAEAKQPERAAA